MEHRVKRLRAGVATAVIVVPLAFVVYLSMSLHDRVRFAFWAARHAGQFHNFQQRDAVIRHWDGWGFAGMDNDSYLAVSTHRDIQSLPIAERWRHDLKLPCEIVKGDHLWRAFYIVTTYNCFWGPAE